MLVFILGTFITASFAQECGVKPDQRPWDEMSYLAGVRDADPGSWPWQLSLQSQKDDGSWIHICGAVLIADKWAISAAHCTEREASPENLRIVAGAWDLGNLTGSQIIGVADIFNHDEFSKSLPVPNDISLIYLSEPADLSSDTVATACLPTTEAEFAGDAAHCWVSGWGVSHREGDTVPNIPEEGYVVVPTNDACESLGYSNLTDGHICAGDGQPNPCRGDSGGPMSCYKDGMWYVAGVTSFGPEECSDVPGVYTRVSAYFKWIVTVMANKHLFSQNTI